MKERYENPVAELVELACDDIIMTSIPEGPGTEEDGDWGDD